jgi:hypothetical protein
MQLPPLAGHQGLSDLAEVQLSFTTAAPALQYDQSLSPPLDTMWIRDYLQNQGLRPPDVERTVLLIEGIFRDAPPLVNASMVQTLLYRYPA